MTRGAFLAFARAFSTGFACLAEDFRMDFGPDVSKRAEWDLLAGSEAGAAFLKKAKSELAKPLQESSEELYLDFSRNGNRTRWQDLNFKRRARIALFAFGEGIEGQGAFLKAFEETAKSLCAERTWVMPAHDGELANLEGRRVEIDLGSSMLACDFAAADSILGSKLSPECRALIERRVVERVIVPFWDMVEGRAKRLWWLTGDNNWNAVCLANVCACGLRYARSPEEKARFVEEPAKFVRHFLSGFPKDGYCKEGVGYWNYGFGHFALLSELLARASKGNVEPMLWPEAQAPALFGFGSEICGGVNISYSDCDPNVKPNRKLLGYVSKRFGLGFKNYERTLAQPGGDSLLMNLLCRFPVERPTAKASLEPQCGLRAWFDDWGVLISRQKEGFAGSFGASVKGGDNDEPHNHNDIGSFIVVKDGVQALCDAGGEVYTKRTFSELRYESEVLNSYGHSVPLVDGKLQRTGRKAKGVVLEKSFSDASDFLKIDIKSAYDTEKLSKLERSFRFTRGDKPAVEIFDEVAFKEPASFEEALLCFGDFEKLADGSLKIGYKNSFVLVQIDSDMGEYEIVKERLGEEMLGGVKPLRIGLKFKDKRSKGFFKAVVTPL